MKKLFLSALLLLFLLIPAQQCKGSYFSHSTPGQKIGAIGLVLITPIAALLAVNNKHAEAAALECFAFGTLFAAPLADDFLDMRLEPKRVNYDRLWLRIQCALGMASCGVVGSLLLHLGKNNFGTK